MLLLAVLHLLQALVEVEKLKKQTNNQIIYT